jgi:hypothetical protein
MTQAGQVCRTAGLVFIPMPMETLGGWHEQTIDQVREIDFAFARHTGKEESEAICHLGQRLSVLVCSTALDQLIRVAPCGATVAPGSATVAQHGSTFILYMVNMPQELHPIANILVLS